MMAGRILQGTTERNAGFVTERSTNFLVELKRFLRLIQCPHTSSSATAGKAVAFLVEQSQSGTDRTR